MVLRPTNSELETWDKTAFHFADGQVLRAWIAPGATLGVHGGIWQVVEPDTLELRTFAIPYSALKGVYRLRQWDSRVGTERDNGASSTEALARVPSERATEQSGVGTDQRSALIDRMKS